MSESRVTIKDISQRLNVSPTTVANALNGRNNVGLELRNKIIHEASSMGYKPNLNAKAMVKNGISIAVMLQKEPKEHITYLRKGIYDKVKQLADFKVSLADYGYHDNMSETEAYDCVRRIIKHNYDGIIISPSFFSESYMDMFKEFVVKNNVPVLDMNCDMPDVPIICSVMVDADTIGKMTAQFIHIAFGKSKVGVISTSEKYNIHKKIVSVFSKECADYGIEIVDVLMNKDSKSETYACTDKLVSEHPDIDVIYMTSFDSVQVCRCLRNKGIEGIKVIGHDVYNEMLEYMKNGQQIASIYLNPYEMGMRGVDVLFNAIMGNEVESKQILIHPELVLRSNLGCYKTLV